MQGTLVNRTLLFAILLSALPIPAVATDDVIVVTATRSESPLKDLIVPVTVINREQIELAAASDIAELLRFEAGLDIGRNGGPGQATSVFLRGTESNHTLVLVDGVRINPGTIGGAALQNIAPEMIERIEIVKGSRSSLYGTDAIGGVINIITRRAGSGYAEAGAGLGSFATRSAYTSMAAAGDSGEAGITLNWQATDGYAIRSDSELERGHDNLSLNLYGRRDFGSTAVSLRHWRAAGNTEYLDFFLNPLDQDYRNESTALELATDFGDRGDSKLLVSHMVDEIEQKQSDDYVISRRLALDWQYAFAIEGHELAAGIFLADENAEALSFGSGFDEDTRTRAVFVQDSISRGAHRMFVAARYTDHATFGSEITWNAEYGIDLNEDWALGVGLGRAFRAPDATDRFGFGGNPELAPEVAEELQLSAQYAPGNGHTLRLELFGNDIDDLIEFDFSTFTLQNLASAEIRGAQLGWAWAGEVYSLQADVLSQRAENADTGTRLLRRADESLTIRGTRRLGRHLVGLSLLAAGEREDFAATLPGYVLVNANGQFRLGDHWQANLRVENLLDTRYETAAPYRMAERSAYLELKYHWQ